MSCIVISRPTF